ncbi:MAG: hypothetical protein MHPSP_004167 [Paramarteilia canceri]
MSAPSFLADDQSPAQSSRQFTTVLNAPRENQISSHQNQPSNSLHFDPHLLGSCQAEDLEKSLNVTQNLNNSMIVEKPSQTNNLTNNNSISLVPIKEKFRFGQPSNRSMLDLDLNQSYKAADNFDAQKTRNNRTNLLGNSVLFDTSNSQFQ